MSGSAKLFVATGGIAVAAAPLAVHGPGLPRVIAGLTLSLVLPGVVIIAALFPRPTITGVERLVLTAAASLAALVAVGLVLHASGVRLTPDAWARTMAAVTVIGSASAWLRARRRPSVPTPRIPAEQLRPVAPPATTRTRALGVVGLAAAVLVVASGWSLRSAEAHDTASFTALWATAAGSGSTRMVHVGVQNKEGHPVQYRVEVAGTSAGRSTFWLPDGRTWTSDLDVPAENAVTVRLFKSGVTEPYRTVFVSGTRS